MKRFTDPAQSGAANLLLNCAQAAAGDRVLLVGEAGDKTYFEPQLCEVVAQVAESLHLRPQVVFAEPGTHAGEFPRSVSDAMQEVDITVFFSRLGDQVRFLETPGACRKIMCYTLTCAHLGSPFATADFKAMKQVHDLLKSTILSARRYAVEAACGTALHGDLKQGGVEDTNLSAFSLELFPVMIFPPINSHRLQGRLVLRDFVTSSSTREYDDSVLHLKSSVIAHVEDSRIVELDGERQEVSRIEQQLERAAQLTGGDAFRINSWHVGINPFTFFEGDPYENLERWGTVAFGSPHYTHFHAAGEDPGDVSIQLFNASITFDDERLWDSGRFAFLDRPDVRELLRAKGITVPQASTSRLIGIA